MKFGLMLDRERGEMCIRRQVAGRAHGFEKPEQDVGVTVARVDEHRLRLDEP